MPELPDLELFSKNLTKSLKNKTIKDTIVTKDKKLNVSKEQFKEALVDKAILNVTRQGKELHFQLTDQVAFGLHLMLKGQLVYYDLYKPSKNPIVEIVFSDNSTLALTDFMAQAMPILNPVIPNVPDALDESLNEQYLSTILKSNKANIKSILIDQKVVRGIGNAYADEILYDCLISPLSIAQCLPENKIKDLVQSIKEVLRDAINQIQIITPNAISGEQRDFLKVHNSSRGETEKGEKINHIEVNSKKTYYVDEQVNYRC